MSDVVLREDSDGVATVTMNRPDALNALTVDLKEALLAALADLHKDDAVRAVVLTGAGRGFCAGQDLREHAQALKGGPEAALSTVVEHYNPIVEYLYGMPKPTVAAVNGVAGGAGAGLAFACDFRIASSTATFLLAFARVGLSLDTGVSWTLPRLIGEGRTRALSLLAEPVNAEKALEMGMVNAVTEPDHTLAAAQELAARLATGPTAAYAAIKESIGYAAGSTLREALAKEGEMQVRVAGTQDHREATNAFVNKEKVTFVGH